ncbi:hypothetical protein PR048_027935 [Dryococelus australis]|uniref:Uncharacterized protein n=1 Tax=Dryococelus australis TaxID=614101 RepID=A0ABQ9GHW5_9NEOP|nr:hypothetical protein PR048_027935 [Dryococelus australis]
MQGRRETGDPRENPPTSGIIRHDSNMRESRGDSARNRTLFALTWAGFNITALRADEGEAKWAWSSVGMRKWGKREIPEKTRRPAASFGTFCGQCLCCDKGVPVAWPPRSPDLVYLSFAFRHFVKSLVYEKLVGTREKLITRIRRAIDTISCSRQNYKLRVGSHGIWRRASQPCDVTRPPYWIQLDRLSCRHDHPSPGRPVSISSAMLDPDDLDLDPMPMTLNYLISHVGNVVDTISAYTRQKTKSKYINRIRLERASQMQSSDTHKTPYYRVKRCRERKINIKVSERVNSKNCRQVTLGDHRHAGGSGQRQGREYELLNQSGVVPPSRAGNHGDDSLSRAALRIILKLFEEDALEDKAFRLCHVRCTCKFDCNTIVNVKHSLYETFHEQYMNTQGNYLMGLILLLPIQRRRNGQYNDPAESRRQATLFYSSRRHWETPSIATGVFKRINHIFLMVGHSFSASDRDFALIEKRWKVSRRQVLEDVESVITSARPAKPFKVLQMRGNFFDFDEAAPRTINTNREHISKLVWLRIDSGNPGVVKFTRSYSELEDFSTCNMLNKGVTIDDVVGAEMELSVSDNTMVIRDPPGGFVSSCVFIPRPLFSLVAGREQVCPSRSAYANMSAVGSRYTDVSVQSVVETNLRISVARAQLDGQFPHRIVGCAVPIAWPARFLDLNGVDYYQWGHLKTIMQYLLRIMQSLTTGTQAGLAVVTRAGVYPCCVAVGSFLFVDVTSNERRDVSSQQFEKEQFTNSSYTDDSASVTRRCQRRRTYTVTYFALITSWNVAITVKFGVKVMRTDYSEAKTSWVCDNVPSISRACDHKSNDSSGLIAQEFGLIQGWRKYVSWKQ